jgi:hypothetical protein
VARGQPPVIVIDPALMRAGRTSTTTVEVERVRVIGFSEFEGPEVLKVLELEEPHACQVADPDGVPIEFLEVVR